MQVYYCLRFDNILGKETINTFKYLTSEIKSIFCHPTMVDRVAAMLNYFLCHLVGPKKKNFKVSIFMFILLLNILKMCCSDFFYSCVKYIIYML